MQRTKCPCGCRQHYSGSLHKQRRDIKSGSPCALLWRLLSRCNLRMICLKACNISGHLDMIGESSLITSRPSDGIVRASGNFRCSKLPQYLQSQMPKSGQFILWACPGTFWTYNNSPNFSADHYSPGVAQDALILSPSSPVVPDTIVPTQPSQLVILALLCNLHRDLLSLNFHAWLLEPL